MEFTAVYSVGLSRDNGKSCNDLNALAKKIFKEFDKEKKQCESKG